MQYFPCSHVRPDAFPARRHHSRCLRTAGLFSDGVWRPSRAHPTHFNAAGDPDRFSARSNWWILPAINLATAALTVGLTLLLPSRPDLLNLPDKQAILTLPRGAQVDVIRKAQPGLMMLGLMVAGVFLFLQYSTWRLAHGHPANGLGGLVVMVPIASLLLLPTVLVPVRRELRRQQAALRR